VPIKPLPLIFIAFKSVAPYALPAPTMLRLCLWIFSMENLRRLRVGLKRRWKRPLIPLILKKRQHYRKVFEQFKPELIARYNKRKITALLNDPGIIRNRLKVEGTVKNARAYLELTKQEGKFSEFLWQFVNGKPILNKWKT